MLASDDVSLQDDIYASTVYFNSLRDYVYSDTTDDGETIYHSHQYLDSNALHYWLGKFEKTFYPHSPVGVHYVPVFIFDFSHTEMMLLDRKHQVVSFPDMVIGVQTEEENVRVPYKCNQRGLSVDGRDVTRQLLGGMIQSVWGVLPT